MSTTHADEFVRRSPPRPLARGGAAPGDVGMLGLQRLAGNSAVTQLVQRSLVQRQDDDDWQGHQDPSVGQGKAVDPGDKGAGISGTFDLSPGVKGTPKVTGAYGDAPSVGGVDPQGGQLKTPGDNDTQSGPTKDAGGSGGGQCGPGKSRDPVTGWCSGPMQSPSDQLGVPPPGPAPQPGDYNVPADDQAYA